MPNVVSKDGTRIAFDRHGDGQPIILVVGAFNERSTGTPLATFLAPHFAAYTYDRRGRGDSGDTAPYAVEREIEDIAAVMGLAGGHGHLYGSSSGAGLALEAAAAGAPVDKLILWEPPYNVDPEGRPPADSVEQLDALVNAGR